MLVKVRHYSYSKTGGAGRCAEAVNSAHVNMGIDSEFVYRIKKGLKSFEAVAFHPSTILNAAVDENLVKAPKTHSLFSLYRSQNPAMGNPSDLELEANDISHLHWVEGMIPKSVIRGALSNGAKIVWTLHDMAPFTGGCHFSLGCERFIYDCQGCPQVRESFRRKVSENLRDKRKYLEGADSSNLRFIAPSSWLREQALASRVLEGFQVDVIPNPISLEFFQKHYGRGRSENQKDRNEFVIAVVAEDLANRVKRVNLLISLLHQVSMPRGKTLVVKLAGRNGSRYHSEQFRVDPTGPLTSIGLVDLFDETDLLVSVSEAESAGMTIKEAGSRGVPSLIFGAPGAKATILNGVTGLIAESENQFVELLDSLIRNGSRLQELGLSAKEDVFLNNRPEIVAGRYLNVYQELLG